MLAIAADPAAQRCAADTADATSAAPAPATDNHPFPYLRTRDIPALYLFVIAGILLMSIICVRAFAGPLRSMRPYTDLFLLGMGFLLLETKYVTGFALLFGTTWLVNAIVFAGVLVAVLVAVEVTRRWPTPPIPILFAALAGALLLAWLVPAATLLELPVVAARRRGRVGVRPDLPGECDLRQAAERRGRHVHRDGCQPARRDGRGLPRVRRIGRRLQRVAVGGGVLYAAAFAVTTWADRAAALVAR